MIKLKIDHKEISVPQGTTILEAARKLGVEIPTMCYSQGYENHPSCMICMVKEKKSGQLIPSCAHPALDGMDIITMDDEVFEARKDALELLLSDHVGDCEAPCQTGCPASMNIPKMNRLIAAGKPLEALKVVKEEIALPLVLGYICTAPCENACRRKTVDKPVAICQLKKYVALEDAKSRSFYLPEKEKSNNKKVAIIGAGPTGMSCSFYLTRLGFETVVFDRNSKPGGSLLNLNTETVLPTEILETEVEILKNYGIDFQLNHTVDENRFKALIAEYNAIVIATGVSGKDSEHFGLRQNATNTGFEVTDGLYSTDLPNVFMCGSAIKVQKMAVRAVAQGKELAYFIDEWIKTGQGKSAQKRFNSRFGRLNEVEVSEYLKETIEETRINLPDKIVNFTAEQAIAEAKSCMHCDCRKPDTCKLRQHAETYGAQQKTYQFGDRNNIKKLDTHQLIIYEQEKCIRCGLCVDITQKVKELIGLTYVGRGFDVRIGIPYNESLQISLAKTAKKCAELCPTGAISLKFDEL